jgi:hypothetical protein
VLQVVSSKLVADNPAAEMVHHVLSRWWRAGASGANGFSRQLDAAIRRDRPGHRPGTRRTRSGTADNLDSTVFDHGGFFELNGG